MEEKVDPHLPRLSHGLVPHPIADSQTLPTMAAVFTGYPYGTYQAPYPTYPLPPGQPMATAAALPHFTTHFPQPPPGYPLYALQSTKAPSPSPGPATAPDIPAISPHIASRQVRKLIVSQLKIGGEFNAVEPQALQRLELEVVACTFPFESSCSLQMLLLRH